MKKLMLTIKQHSHRSRLIYWLLVVLLFVFVVMPIFFFFYLFNEDQVKQAIIQQFDNNNYHVNVGHISPKFWHGLALDVGEVDIQNRQFEPMFKIDNMSCQLSWIDLVFGRYKVSRVNINGVDVNEANVMKNLNIVNMFRLNHNYSGDFDRIQDINIYGVDIVGESTPYPFSDGSLQIHRHGSNVQFELGFKLNLRKIYVLLRGQLDEVTDTDLKFDKFDIFMYNGSDFQLKLAANSTYNFLKQKLTLTKVLGQSNLNNYKSDFTAKSLSLDSFGVDVKQLTTDTNYSNYFASNELKLNFDDLYLKQYKQIFINQLNANYKLSSGANSFEISSKISDIGYNESLMMIKPAYCSSVVKVAMPNISPYKMSSEVSGSCAYYPKKSLIDLDLSGEVNQALLSLKMQIINKTDVPYIVMSGNVDSIDLSRLDMSKSKLLPLLYDNSKLPFKWLSLVNVNGNLKIKTFALDRINLNNVVSRFIINNGALNISKLDADIYGGRLSGSINLQKIGDSNYNLQIKQVVRNISLKNMFEDLFDVEAISGRADMTTDVKANNISTYEDIHQNLAGKIILSAVNGAFQGIDLNLFVNPNVMNLANNNKATSFEKLQASFDFNSGVSRYGAITFSSKYVIASGAGILDLDNSKINYNLSIKSALPQNETKFNSVLIPVLVSGDLFKPKVTIKNIHLYKSDIVTGDNKILRHKHHIWQKHLKR